MYCVYKHTFPNNKVYIGITSINPLKRWKSGEGYRTQLVYRAIKKYGWDNIQHEIICDRKTAGGYIWRYADDCQNKWIS